MLGLFRAKITYFGIRLEFLKLVTLRQFYSINFGVLSTDMSVFLGQKHHTALWGKCFHSDHFYVWLLRNGMHSLWNTILKKEPFWEIFRHQFLDIFAVIFKKGDFPVFISTYNGIHNLLPHGFLIYKAQSEVHDPCCQKCLGHMTCRLL